MTTELSDVGRDLYEQLTARTFHVVDTEFCTHDGEHHLISIAVVPVVGGHRIRSRGELYREMNPGVPIDRATSSIHGFTDADVAGKRTFATYAKVILERLRDDDAVFVCHNTIDAHVLRRELQRLQTAGEPSAAEAPDLPILDTQRLATVVDYPGINATARISLDALCDLTGVARSAKAHDAREDARATANALIELLRHCAERAIYWTFDDLLAAATGGTLHHPQGPAHIRSKRTPRPQLPAEHLAKHIDPLSDPVAAGSAEAERWLDLAAECASLRCPHLRDEAQVAAINGAILLRPLMDDLPHLTEPGQAGTLLGAVHDLLAAAPTPGIEPTLTPPRALRWWQSARDAIRDSVPCEPGSPDKCCPSCLDSQPCPRDVVRLPVAEIVTLASGAQMTDARARTVLAPKQKSALNTWRKHHPDVLAYAMWRIAAYQFDEGLDEVAYTTVDRALALNLHTLDPRLTQLVCERLLETGHHEQAFTLAQTVLDQRSTDPAYDDLADWVLYTRNAIYAQQPISRPPITHPRRARPAGHVNPRLYS